MAIYEPPTAFEEHSSGLSLVFPFSQSCLCNPRVNPLVSLLLKSTCCTHTRAYTVAAYLGCTSKCFDPWRSRSFAHSCELHSLHSCTAYGCCGRKLATPKLLVSQKGIWMPSLGHRFHPKLGPDRVAEIRLGHPPSSRFWRYHSEGTGAPAGFAQWSCFHWWLSFYLYWFNIVIN